ncbi:MAG: inorganic phosphate transporter [Nitrospinae bacterium]|nr:inorganic phosphate transporter [Nitrospinota bacterium]MDA1110507.1 inorganic phosphate transporter [Nitrospinota bacterium]
MDFNTILLAVAILAGVYMACNIGANDVANAMGTSVGSKALTFQQAIMIAAVAEFAGAFLVGGHVSDTIRKGILDPVIFQDTPLHLVYGMIASLVAAGVWLHIASSLGWPVSTTHSIVGAVVGFGIVAGGWDALNWVQVGKVVLSWIISPALGALVSYLLFRFLKRQIFSTRNPLQHTKEILPYLVFLVFVILSQSMVYKGLKNLHLDLQFSQAAVISIAVGFIAFFGAKFLVPTNKDHRGENLQTQFVGTEAIFRYLQVITAFYVAFAHGSNDVANAVGPLAAVVSILKEGSVQMKVEMPLWILGMGGACIVLGLLIWGRRVMQTVGKEITEMTPSRGFCAEFGAATVVLICSKLGLPISTTHTLVGSVVGVGLARGLPTLNLSIIKTIFVSWAATIPFTAVFSIIFFKMMLFIFP